MHFTVFRPGRRRLLFEELLADPDDQTGARDRKDDPGDPAAADPEEVPDQAADDAADDAEEDIPEDAFGLSVHDHVGDVTADSADDQLNDQLDQHFSLLLRLFEVALQQALEGLAVPGLGTERIVKIIKTCLILQGNLLHSIIHYTIESH